MSCYFPPESEGRVEDIMAQSDLTKENAANCHEAVNEMFEAIPKSKKLE